MKIAYSHWLATHAILLWVYFDILAVVGFYIVWLITIPTRKIYWSNTEMEHPLKKYTFLFCCWYFGIGIASIGIKCSYRSKSLKEICVCVVFILIGSSMLILVGGQICFTPFSNFRFTYQLQWGICISI